MGGPITGTFIDEITFDIPSSNWSAAQWRRDLDAMQAIGIDTLVFIRGGLGYRRTIYPSAAFGTLGCFDLADLLLDEASKRGMDVYFGLYVTDLDWNHGDVAGELRKNRALIDEVWPRYGHYPAFKGWYIPHETCCDMLNITEVMNGLAAMCKDKAPDKAVMISPLYKTPLTWTGWQGSPAEFYEEWDRLLDRCGKQLDICAFQDGTAPMEQMEDYFIATEKLCRKHDMAFWVNTETFERDVRRMYFPIPFELLRQKLEIHQKRADKIITFEFSHFMSPHSIFPSAANLYELYKEYYQRRE